MGRLRRNRHLLGIGATALLGLGPMLLAGQPAWALLSITGAALATFTLLIRAHDRPIGLIEADFVVVAALLWTLVQLVPLPDAWLEESILRSRALAGVEASGSLSFDPGGTKERVVVCVLVIAAYATGRLGARVAGRRALLYVAAASCAAMAMVAFGHELVSARRVFGLYEPLDTRPALMSPILNSNQLGGFLAFGAVLWLGLGFSAKERPEAFGAATLGTLCCLGALGTGSRGAALGLAIGFASALLVLFRSAKSKRRIPSRQVLVAVGVIGIVLALFSVTGMSRMVLDITDGDYSKFELIAEGAQMSLSRPLLGVGRGGFEAAFASNGTSNLRFTHPENLPVQWASEWGWGFTLLAFGVWVRFLWRAARSKKVYVAIGATAVVSLIIHDLFDFALEMPGILVLVMMTIGAIAPLRGGPALRPRGQLAVALSLVLLGIFFGSGVSASRFDAVSLAAESAEVEELRDLARRAIADHPLDPSVSLVLSARMAAIEDPSALRWLNRTMELAPAWSSPHEIASRLLARRGAYAQALLEARQAEAQRPGSAAEISCSLVARMELEPLVSSVAGSSDAVFAEEWGNRLVDCMQPERALRFDDVLIMQQPTSGALLRRARYRLAAENVDGALEDLMRIPEEARTDTTALLWARVVAAKDGPAAGLAYLDAHVERVNEDPRMLAIRAELAAGAENDGALEQSLSLLRTLAAGNGTEIAAAWAVAGRCYREMGRTGEALAAYQRAHNLAPDENRYVWAMIRLSRTLGLSGEAATHLRTLCRRGEERACRQESRLP